MVFCPGQKCARHGAVRRVHALPILVIQHRASRTVAVKCRPPPTPSIPRFDMRPRPDRLRTLNSPNLMLLDPAFRQNGVRY